MRFEENITIDAPASKIFEQYQAVNHWHVWDADVKEAALFGDFSQGATGWLKPSHGPKSKFVLAEVMPNQSFTSVSKLPLCTITFVHTLKETQTHTIVTHQVIFDGLLKNIFGKLIGQNIEKGLPQALKGLKSVCEDNQ